MIEAFDNKKPDFRSILKKAGRYILIFHAVFILSIAVSAILYIFIDPPFTSLQVYRYIFNGYSTKKHHDISLGSIPRRYQRLVIYTEDPRFYRHFGVDPGAVESAVRVNLRYGKKISGASTITQQLTRTLFLFPDKLYVRKYLETIAALTIDLVMPKKRILELYFNYAEWGRGIYGIQSASYYYYGLPLNKLTDDQVIRLITLLPSPCRYSPDTFEKRKRLLTRYNNLNETMAGMNTAK
ncbi:MAG TPA: biosynthetic peptidoglycan transglycosylase [Spirochaetota bacterium]|nr:biosynthetic peptidoglycan transglycosylase [Spirochaetota bacterium]